MSSMEAAAVVLGVQALLGGGGEIHNSGNWAGGLKTTDDGGKLNVAGFREHRKKEKRAHRPDIATPEKSFGTKSHFHVYIPNDGGPLNLPAMYHEEAEKALENAKAARYPTAELEATMAIWKSRTPMEEAELRSVVSRLNDDKLTRWLEDNCQRKLVEANP